MDIGTASPVSSEREENTAQTTVVYEAPSEVPPNSPPPVLPVSSVKGKSRLPVLIVLLGTLLILAGGVFLVLKSGFVNAHLSQIPGLERLFPQQSSSSVAEPPSVPPAVPESPAPQVKQAPLSTFPRKLFDASVSFALGKGYPDTILSLKDSDLVGIKCSRTYNLVGGRYVYTVGADTVELKDPAILAFISGNPASGKIIGSISSCTTEAGKTLAIYTTEGAATEGVSVTYFGYLIPNSSTPVSFASVESSGTSPFVCTKPLALTSSDVLYYECGGPEKEAIYKIDLGNATSSAIYSCQSTSSGVEGTAPVVTCTSR